MTWNKTTEPKVTGWYICTIEDNNQRWVVPLFRGEWPPNNFYWDGLNRGKVVACVAFPKPYEGAPR